MWKLDINGAFITITTVHDGQEVSTLNINPDNTLILVEQLKILIDWHNQEISNVALWHLRNEIDDKCAERNNKSK